MKIIILGLALMVCLSLAGQEKTKTDSTKLKVGDEYAGIELIVEKYGNDHSLPATIKINTRKVINRPSKAVLGYNHNWYQMQFITGIEGTTEINPKYLELLKGFPMPLNRMSGTGSQNLKWKGTIGRLEERIEQTGVYEHQKFIPGIGLIEWIQSCLLVDPEARFNFVFNLNLGDESANDAADWVEFLTGDGKSNPRGGTNWAQRRIELGLEKPVPVDFWELGNETDWHSKMNFTKEQYLEMCKKIIPAVKEVDPNAVIVPHCITAPWNKKKHKTEDEWRDWHRLLLKEIGDDIDHLAFHCYYEGIPVRMVLGGYVKMVEDDVLEITGSDRIKVFLSEHATWPRKNIPSNASDEHANFDMNDTQTMEAIVKTMDYYIRAYNYPFVSGAAYHSFRAGPWKLVDISPEGKLWKTGLVDMFKLLNDAHSDKVLATELEGKYCDVDAQNPTANFLSCAFENGDQIRVLLVNKSPITTRHLKIDIKGKYKMVEQQIITAENFFDYNTASEEKIKRTIKKFDRPKEIDAITIIPKSAYLITLHKVK